MESSLIPNTRSFTGKASKGEDHSPTATEEDGTSDNASVPLLHSSPANMKAVKAVLQNGSARIVPASSTDHSTSAADSGGNMSKKAAALPYQNTENTDVPEDR